MDTEIQVYSRNLKLQGFQSKRGSAAEAGRDDFALKPSRPDISPTSANKPIYSSDKARSRRSHAGKESTLFTMRRRFRRAMMVATRISRKLNRAQSSLMDVAKLSPAC